MKSYLLNNVVNKFKPWAYLIIYYFLLAIGIVGFMKIEEKFYFETTIYRDIAGFLSNALPVIGIYIFYKRINPLISSFFSFSFKFFLFGLITSFFLIFLHDFLPKILIPYETVMIDFSLFYPFSIKCVLKVIILTAIFAPIMEEIFFRNILLNLFLENYSAIMGIVFSGLAFAIVHISPTGESNLLAFSAFFARWFHGVLLSAVTYKTKNLSFAFGFHISNNFLALLTS